MNQPIAKPTISNTTPIAIVIVQSVTVTSVVVVTTEVLTSVFVDINVVVTVAAACVTVTVTELQLLQPSEVHQRIRKLVFYYVALGTLEQYPHQLLVKSL